MLSETALIAAVAGLAGSIIGGGGLYAWFKVGPERRKMMADIHSGILKDTHAAYQHLNEELSQVRMTNISLEKENEDCRDKVFQLQHAVFQLQEDINRHGRMSELSRRKSHIAIHALGGYELHIEHLLDKMRDAQIPIAPLDRPTRLRQAFQLEMDKLEELEAIATEQAIHNGDPASE